MTKFKARSSAAKAIAHTAYKYQLRDFLIGAQMLFVAFGALVLVPILAGLDPNLALLTSGIGTLCYELLTRLSKIWNKFLSFLRPKLSHASA